ncbi:MAG: DUF2442 domain-containing protein [Methylococcaceae bacterium]
MFLHVTEARYLDAYRIEVAFNNGKKGIADLADALKGPVFESLKNTQAFARFKVDTELETIAWENGADLAPEYIYYQAFKNETDLQMQFKDWGYVK